MSASDGSPSYFEDNLAEIFDTSSKHNKVGRPMPAGLDYPVADDYRVIDLKNQ